MASYEELEVTAALRQRARLVFAEFEDVIREMSRGMDFDQQLGLTLPMVTYRRLLAGDEAPPATIEVPANVRRLVLPGKQGLRSGAMDLPAPTQGPDRLEQLARWAAMQNGTPADTGRE